MDVKIQTRDIRSSVNTKRDQVPIQLDEKDQPGRNFAEVKKVKKAKKLAKQAELKNRREEEDRQKFDRLLNSCIELLARAINNGGEIFKLLDPLIGDTQCHMHTVLILNTLRKCYDINDRRYVIEKLGDEDKKILATAVLFTLMKNHQKDKVGLIIREVSFCHLDSLSLCSKNREAYIIAELRCYFNSQSLDFIKSSAIDKFEEIFNSCEDVRSEGLRLKYLPCYSSIHAVINYLKAQKLPIIVPFVSITSQVMGEDTRYVVKSYDLRFYEYREDEDRYYHKMKLTDSEKEVATVTFAGYNLITAGTRGLSMDLDIVDLLLVSVASHGQLPKNAMLPSGDEHEHEFVRKLYAKNADVYDEFNHFYELGKKYDLIDARYCRLRPISSDQGTDKYFIIERRKEGIRFGVDHIYVSNYSHEYNRMMNADPNVEVYESEIHLMKTKQTPSGVLKRLGLVSQSV